MTDEELKWHQKRMHRWERDDGLLIEPRQKNAEGRITHWWVSGMGVVYGSARDAMTWADRNILDIRLMKKADESAYPDDNPKTAYGDRKPPLHLVPPALVVHVAGVFKLGARKYGPYNWREKTVSWSVYQGAAWRHLLAMADGEWIDPESGQPHAAHVAACMGIMLDAKAIDKFNDDRPPAGAAARLIREAEEGMQ